MKSSPNPTEKTDHERKDADVVSLLVIGAVLLLVLILVSLASRFLMHNWNRKENAAQERPARVVANAIATEPRLEVTPSSELTGARKREEAELNSYGWIDRSRGLVRIPIERAMRLIGERGLPEVGSGLTPLQLMQTRPDETGTPAPVLNKTP